MENKHNKRSLVYQALRGEEPETVDEEHHSPQSRDVQPLTKPNRGVVLLSTLNIIVLFVSIALLLHAHKIHRPPKALLNAALRATSSYST